MTTVTIHYAKTNLSKLIAKVEKGERVVIARGKTPVVELNPPAALGRQKIFGVYKDHIKFAPDYDQADAEILEMFEESSNKPI